MTRRILKSKQKKVKQKVKTESGIHLYWNKVDWQRAERIFKNDRDDILASLKREIKRYPYAEEILRILAAGSFVSASLIFPNFPRLFKSRSRKIWNGKGYDSSRLKQTLKRLRNQKEVKVAETKEGYVVKITQKGMVKALRYKLGEMKIEKPEKWDGKWRLVIFDIPNSKKMVRDYFRERLKALGFYSLQESVLVYPYSCFDEIELLRQVYGIGKNTRFIVAEEIEEEEKLRRVFNI